MTVKIESENLADLERILELVTTLLEKTNTTADLLRDYIQEHQEEEGK